MNNLAIDFTKPLHKFTIYGELTDEEILLVRNGNMSYGAEFTALEDCFICGICKAGLDLDVKNEDSELIHLIQSPLEHIVNFQLSKGDTLIVNNIKDFKIPKDDKKKNLYAFALNKS